MGFTDLVSEAGLTSEPKPLSSSLDQANLIIVLNQWLTTRSYIVGYVLRLLWQLQLSAITSYFQ